ncbi:hypothetical protein P3339_02520 [Microbulbifer sp. MLAF003]|uniref:hypothetical protein n=1 Tax=Microbulbifer sp. MLAF003 TaxID=3032582 RepID=UPI0024ACBAA5|nr:hypothetical protein [Microbulbifer sp. MLAF003]WHI51727.1 hypothetical protein P3339_02520 [Microbulbifer sp. MLAF003]
MSLTRDMEGTMAGIPGTAGITDTEGITGDTRDTAGIKGDIQDTADTKGHNHDMASICGSKPMCRVRHAL